MNQQYGVNKDVTNSIDKLQQEVCILKQSVAWIEHAQMLNTMCQLF